MSTVTSGITSPFPFLRLYRAYIDQWRVCFEWTAEGPTKVEIVD
jgi:hypothetical protein